MDIKEQNFGLEYEFSGITRNEAADILADYFGTTSYHHGGSYDKYYVLDNRRRKWEIVYDSSITAYTTYGSYADSEYKCEFVTPICQYEDIETIQQILRKLRAGGARSNSSCGIHIHIDGANHSARSIKNLVNIMASKEDVLIKALDIKPTRSQYCQKTEQRFISELNSQRNPTLNRIKEIWYNGRTEASDYHYDNSRYRMLNLHSYFGNHHTIEFRCFNSCNHAGKVKAYIQFCLAMSAQAINQNSARYQPMDRANDKYTFRTWLLRMHLIGDEYKTCRLHMMSNLEGTSDYKDREAAMQRRREMAMELAARVERARQESPNPETFTIEQLPRETTYAENGQPIFSLREQLDSFLESINADAEITLSERNQILSILNSRVNGGNTRETNENQQSNSQPALAVSSTGRRSR